MILRHSLCAQLLSVKFNMTAAAILNFYCKKPYLQNGLRYQVSRYVIMTCLIFEQVDAFWGRVNAGPH